MPWLSAVERLRSERQAGILVTLLSVRGHAPREAGAKMVVSADQAWDSIGGGNLEATAVARARELIARAAVTPEQLEVSLSHRARTEHGRQCCGGEVVVLLEPLPVVPAVAVFGLGHVGVELARILARHDLDLHLVDSRDDRVAETRRSLGDDVVARVHLHHAVLPELVLAEVPTGTHVLVMTHDHAEDAALCDAALRCRHLATVGLIGSSAKWTRFRSVLAEAGHSPDAVARVRSPIGLPDLVGKDPATIAVGVAAELLQLVAAERPPSPRPSGTGVRAADA